MISSEVFRPNPISSRKDAWQPTRLNTRYHPALRLAELVTSVEHGFGGVAVNGFLPDMPKLSRTSSPWRCARRWSRHTTTESQEVNRVLGLFEVPDLTILCGRLLAAGMRACADMAERARARRDSLAVDAALAAVGELTSWVGRTGGTPLTDHPYQASIPACGPPGAPSAAGWLAPATHCLACGSDEMGRSGLPAPCRICVVAERRGPARYRPAHRSGHRLGPGRCHRSPPRTTVSWRRTGSPGEKPPTRTKPGTYPVTRGQRPGRLG